MKINAVLANLDPSRCIVYQMLDYVSDMGGSKLVQVEVDNLFLSKTEPFIDSLYNYAHVFGKKLSENDLQTIKDFFKDQLYRIKTFVAPNINDLLLSRGFKLKDTSSAMIISDLANQDYSYSLESNLKILRADNHSILEQAKLIFAEAFDCQLADYNRKFGFLDQIILNNQDQHIKVFVLYENNQPVSTGAYYAFDKFSLENIGTIKSARGRGYAGLMLRILLQEAQRLHYQEACLVASEVGRSIYEKADFKTLAEHNTYILG